MKSFEVKDGQLHVFMSHERGDLYAVRLDEQGVCTGVAGPIRRPCELLELEYTFYDVAWLNKARDRFVLSIIVDDCPQPPSPAKGPKQNRPMAERFWEKVDKSGECWMWRGASLHSGTGMFLVCQGETQSAHRVAYELTYGSIPERGQVRHSCKNTGCVNPAHLYLLAPVTPNIDASA